MRTRVVGCALALAALAGLARAEQPQPRAPAVDPAVVKPLVEANTAFAVDLYRQVARRPGNLFFSPYSISAALAMTREGARGTTRAQMGTVLHLPGADAAARYRDLAELLRPPLIPDGYGKGARQIPAYELQIANRLWGQRGLGFLPAFLSSLRASFGAALQEVDFRGNAPAAREAINRWIAEATRNRIRDAMPPGQPRPDTRLVLANAIYFKAGWVDDFAKSQTVVGPFHRSDGTTLQTPLMRQRDDFTYGEADGVQLLWMAYRGGELSMLVVLPRAPGGLAAVEAKLDTATLAAWHDAMTRRDVKVTFPRFRFTSSLGLGEPLGALGMHEVFTSRADLKGMTRSEPLFLAQAFHKAFVAVDEEGTEAAAATTVITASAEPGAPEPPQPRVFKADHPFFFLIRHRKTGTILFMGRVSDPARS